MVASKWTGTVLSLCLSIGSMATMVLAQPQNAAQAPHPTFDAASVKPSKGRGGPSTQVLPGRLMAGYSSLRDLITFAYGVRADQIVEGPTWIVSDHYDIEAKAAGSTPGSQIAGPMLQALLEDRFKLGLHRETRQLPVYDLTVVKNGPKLQPTKEGSCTRFSPDSPPLPQTPGTPRMPYCGPRTGRDGLKWTLNGQGISMEALAGTLSFQVARSVMDRTGLTGSYDVRLEWAEDPLAAGAPGNPGAPPVSDDLAGPSLFTSLREQLGLRMDAAKGPVEVLVIDHAERPSEN
jgi:uncharacterized protein (TIGR03435 family)